MKILRKRVGSLPIENYKEIEIINDSIFEKNKIIFNYLPIKNLNFFSLKLNKSNFGNKYWIYLDLNLNCLYKEILKGKIIINRDLIFDMVISSLNRLKIKNITDDNIIFNKISCENLIYESSLKYDRFYCFDNSFVKYGKIYFDIKRKLTTIDKCKKKILKIPSIFVFDSYYQIRKTVVSLLNNSIVNNQNSLFIISKKNTGLIDSILFNPFFKENIKNIIYSEDLNYQMRNYSVDLKIEDFFIQLEFESNSFFIQKKNIFIFADNLSDLSISYISFSNFEKIFFKNFKKIEKVILKLADKYNNLRINRNDKFDNLLVSNYILLKRIFLIEFDKITYNKELLKINNFPYTEWINLTDKHFLSLEKKNKLISNFIKIGMKNEWSESYLDSFKNILNFETDETCPISLTKLNSYSIKTECLHCFNLNSLMFWLKDNNECPICRKHLDVENFEFNSFIDITTFIKSLNDFEQKITIICDNLWYEKFNDNKSFLKKKNNIKLISQIDYVVGKARKDKSNLKSFILNLSGLTNNDIIFIENEFNYHQNVNILELSN
tara:strand:- start:1661 stop:3313 length:1653 start_codon:yes stop_codon:yes gene_type:complete